MTHTHLNPAAYLLLGCTGLLLIICRAVDVFSSCASSRFLSGVFAWMFDQPTQHMACLSTGRQQCVASVAVAGTLLACFDTINDFLLACFGTIAAYLLACFGTLHVLAPRLFWHLACLTLGPWLAPCLPVLAPRLTSCLPGLVQWLSARELQRLQEAAGVGCVLQPPVWLHSCCLQCIRPLQQPAGKQQLQPCTCCSKCHAELQSASLCERLDCSRGGFPLGRSPPDLINQ